MSVHNGTHPEVTTLVGLALSGLHIATAVKGIAYDWQQFVFPHEVDFDAELAALLAVEATQ
ncbi:MAG: hypothetical protein EBV24_09985 [Actinobacteria bacterium]|nr:hypothetical protein [Actinomycetota bacterium]